jgi:phosphatidylinositol 4-kinase
MHLQVISKHRNILHKYIALRASEIRALSPGYVIFLLAMHDMETMRSSGGRPSSLVTYFLNDSLNKNIGLGACMESIAEKVAIWMVYSCSWRR